MTDESAKTHRPSGTDNEGVPENGPTTERNSQEQNTNDSEPGDSVVKSELEDLQERLLRVSADYQNFVRRTHQNIAEAKHQQLMDMARSLLPVLDHFDRALGIDPQHPNTETLLQGIRMVHDELIKTLEQFGIQRMAVAIGTPFDPTRHEALMKQPVEGVATNHVSLHLQVGYTIGERTLRPAKVAVAP